MDERSFLARFRNVDVGSQRPHPGGYPAPAYPPTWERFGRVLAAVGGRLWGPVARTALPGEVAKVIAEIKALAPGRCVASGAAALLLGAPAGWERVPDAGAAPHQLADVELGILTAELAVAENAALLTSARTLPERGLGFLPQHLCILVDSGVLLPDLVTAQARLPVPPPHHMTWVSGPSKTADIEQTLVIGAHGARSLTVIAYTG